MNRAIDPESAPCHWSRIRLRKPARCASVMHRVDSISDKSRGCDSVLIQLLHIQRLADRIGVHAPSAIQSSIVGSRSSMRPEQVVGAQIFARRSTRSGRGRDGAEDAMKHMVMVRLDRLDALRLRCAATNRQPGRRTSRRASPPSGQTPASANRPWWSRNSEHPLVEHAQVADICTPSGGDLRRPGGSTTAESQNVPRHVHVLRRGGATPGRPRFQWTRTSAAVYDQGPRSASTAADRCLHRHPVQGTRPTSR